MLGDNIRYHVVGVLQVIATSRCNIINKLININKFHTSRSSHIISLISLLQRKNES